MSASLAQSSCKTFNDPEHVLRLQPAANWPQPALFLDRDGVIIEDHHHLCDPAQVVLCAGAQQLIQAAAEAGWPVVVVTNQSGIARGLFSWEQYEQVSARMLELLGPAAPIAALYANGCGPDAPSQSWRKPSPAMLMAAAGALNLQLAASVLVGDRLSDLQAGVAAGLREVCHVLSGHGAAERPAVVEWFSRAEQRGKPEQPLPALTLQPDLEHIPLEIFAAR